MVQTGMEIVQQFDPLHVANLRGKSQKIWDWLQTYLVTCPPDKLKNVLRFFTGTIFIPAAVEKRRFIHSSGPTPRLPFSRTCSGVVEMDDRYISEAVFHQALDQCFTDTQMFGHR